MPFHERESIIKNLVMVNEVISFEDDEQGSCCNALEKIKIDYPNDEIIFCNGGDRQTNNIPEMNVKNIFFQFGVGGENKINSSSIILRDWQHDSEERVWGKFYNLFQDDRLKLKELVLQPNQGMSFQRHHKRSEIWFVSKGSCTVKHSLNGPKNINETNLSTEDVFHIKRGEWHQLINPFEKPCHIIEIQYGELTSEEDIERLYYYNKD
tara:strand:+ start:1913 stop:2539 length:627 start_codon:yes stop_codon:yes gene_type:complete